MPGNLRYTQFDQRPHPLLLQPILGGFNPNNNVQPLQISTQINVPGSGPASTSPLASLFQPLNLTPRLLPRTRTMAAINSLGENRRRDALETMLRVGVMIHTLDVRLHFQPVPRPAPPPAFSPLFPPPPFSPAVLP
jgi:hypothetical protein